MHDYDKYLCLLEQVIVLMKSESKISEEQKRNLLLACSLKT